MLRRQDPDPKPLSFLAGRGEMAARIRRFDWAAHPFGPPETWPQSLRAALGICLNSAFPTAIYWGPELRLLYNDAWSTIPGPRHPGCLGEPARTVWADIWSVIEPQFAKLIETGEGIFVDDQLLPMRRFGFEEETYWTYNFTPIRGRDGTIEGIFNSGHEVTDKVLKRRQAEFLLKLSDDFRHLSGSDRVLSIVCEALGVHLRAMRVGIKEVTLDVAGTRFPVIAEWTAQGVEPLGSRMPLHRMGEVATSLRAGNVARIDRAEDLDDDDLRRLFAEVGASAALAVPRISMSGLTAVVFVHLDRPHRWTDDEITTVEQVVERTLHAVERERAFTREKAMMGEIDHRARNLLGVVRAIVRLNSADDVPSYREKLMQRLAALASTQSVLAEGEWIGASLRDILATELAPYHSEAVERVHLDGPEVTMDPRRAQAISMAVHELATNAVKHGALSRIDGELSVSWRTSEGGLTIRWIEKSDHLAAEGVGERSGFGSTLLRELIERQLGGTVSRNRAEGLFECFLDIPTAGAAVHDMSSSVGTTGGGAGRRLMVVEDDPIIAMDLEDRLQSLGFAVVATANNLRAALSALDTSLPDAAIVDVNLGQETSEPLAVLMQARQIPFVQLTGYEREPNTASAFFGRPRLRKPFDDESLRAALESVFNGG